MSDGVIAAFGTWGGWAALTAVGTVGAVVVAVGLQWWLSDQAKKHRPQLALAFDKHARATEVNQAGASLPYLRLAVTNAAGKETARDVEVLLLDIEERAKSPAGSGGRRIWLANPAMGWANSLAPLPQMSIPRGATRYLDICRWAQLTDIPHRSSLLLCVVPEPGTNRHVLGPGAWALRLSVTLRNGDASFWEVVVSYEDQATAGLFDPKNIEFSVEQLPSTGGAS